MAQQISRCNLSAARFPLISNFQGRTIILPQNDMNFQKSAIFAGADNDRDVGVPQVYYMHNVMPTEQGYQSVGFTQVIAPVIGTVDFDQAISLQDSAGNKFLWVPAAGKNYVFDAPVLSWMNISAITGLSENVLVTSAFVNGQTYVFYAKTGCFKYNSLTKVFDAVVLTGLVTANIIGICSSNGYLLAWDTAGVLYWSSTVDVTDFTPSLVTGASSGGITDLKGKIVVILSTVNGFIVYSTQNAVGGSFTGNIRFPFTLKEIPGSGGVRAKEHISFESNLEEQYALTSVGIQTLTKTSAKTLMPETADFLTARAFEDFNSVTKIFTTTYLSNDLKLKFTVIGARYFIISYGILSLTHALIYDLTQKKWGKVKIDHVDCFQYTYPNLYGEITYAILESIGTLYSDLDDTIYADLSTSITISERPKRNIGFLQRDGTIKLLNFDLGILDNDAVFLLGKYQFTRTQELKLLGFEVESIDQGNNYAAFVLPSFDGKNFQPAVTPYLRTNAGLLRTYQCRKTAKNHTLLFVGTFNLASVQIIYTQGGVVRG